VNKNGSPVRKGSIPMVLIVVVCLGLFAATAIFMTQNQASLDKKSELNSAAWVIAQSAVEEILLRMQNSQVAPKDDARTTFDPIITKDAMKGLDGLTFGDDKAPGVSVFKRKLETAGVDPQKEKEFNELMMFLPGFLRTAAVQKDPSRVLWAKKGGNQKIHFDPQWRKELITRANNGEYDKRFAAIKQVKDAENFNPATDLEGHAKEYYDTFMNGNGAESQTATGKAVAAAFDNLQPLTRLGDMTNGDHISSGELATFQTQYNKCMEAIGDHMQARIDGCNGDFDYAIGAMMSSFARGAPNANDSDPGEETYREGARDSGQTKYLESLVTISTKVYLKRGTQSATQPYSAQRLIRSMNLQTVVEKLDASMLAYLHFAYNLTYKDMLELKHGSKGALINGDPANLTAPPAPNNENLRTVLADRFSSNPQPQIRNVQLATCLAEPKK
jgi:hypothetical protein